MKFMEKPISVRVIDLGPWPHERFVSARHETYSGGRFKYVGVMHDGTETVFNWSKLAQFPEGYEASITTTTDWADWKESEE